MRLPFSCPVFSTAIRFSAIQRVACKLIANRLLLLLCRIKGQARFLQVFSEAVQAHALYDWQEMIWEGKTGQAYRARACDKAAAPD